MEPDSLHVAVEIVRDNEDSGFWSGLLSFLEITAWPITFIVIAALFRGRIKDLIDGIEGIKHGDTEVLINRDLTEAEDEAKVADIHADTGSESTSDPEYKRLKKMASTSPIAAILGAWNLLEEGIIAAAMAKETPFPDYLPNYQIMRLLREEGYVDQEEAVYNRLRSIRNETVHSKGESIDHELAKRYVDLAWPLYERLMEIARTN